mmetsp:Transcript_11726/g.26541  ORF Transcript_11726/g.26541 Transcript_11726/m.26541 type:complete len:210 (-) Transcript_11726:55-684(-)
MGSAQCCEGSCKADEQFGVLTEGGPLSAKETRAEQVESLASIAGAAGAEKAIWSRSQDCSSLTTQEGSSLRSGSHSKPSDDDDAFLDGDLDPIIEVTNTRLTPPTFTIFLRREEAGQRIGISMYCRRQEQCIRIQDIMQDGLAKKWNHCQPLRMLRPGDAIVEVNGAHEADEMRRILMDRTMDVWTIEIQPEFYLGSSRSQGEWRERSG